MSERNVFLDDMETIDKTYFLYFVLYENVTMFVEISLPKTQILFEK